MEYGCQCVLFQFCNEGGNELRYLNYHIPTFWVLYILCTCIHPLENMYLIFSDCICIIIYLLCVHTYAPLAWLCHLSLLVRRVTQKEHLGKMHAGVL